MVAEASTILTKRVIDDACIQQPFKLFVGSWNVGGIPPPHNFNLDNFLHTQDSMADIYVLGFQEIVPLNAGNILAAADHSNISIKWNSLIKAALNKRTPKEDAFHKTEIGESQRVYPLKTKSYIEPGATDYKCIISKQMVGIYLTIWARTEISQYISSPSVSCVGCGILGRLGNKVECSCNLLK